MHNKTADVIAPTAAATKAVASAPGATPQTQRGQGEDRRKMIVDRRSGIERRSATANASAYTGPERRVAQHRADASLERRRGPGRRRSDDRKAAEEGEMTAEQFEFVMAIESYKKLNKRLYPTWTEVLEVLGQLGYRKVLKRNFDLANVPEPEISTAA